MNFIKTNKHIIFKRIISIVLVVSFITSDIAFAIENASRSALAPPLATDPSCKIVERPDGTLDIETNPIENGLKKYWAFVDVSILIGQMLERGRTKRKLKHPRDLLMPLIEKHLKNREEQGETISKCFDLQSLQEIWNDDNLTAFSIWVEQGGIKSKLIYSLSEDIAGPAYIPIGADKKVFVKAEVSSEPKENIRSKLEFFTDKETSTPEQALEAIFGDDLKARGFLSLATRLRTIYPHTMIKNDSRPPLQYALEEGPIFQIGPNLFITPITESFRRHMIFAKNKNGEIAFAFEVLIPGQYIDKRDIGAERRHTIALKINNAFPGEECCAQSIFRKEFPDGTYSMYKSEYQFDRKCPLQVLAFDYRYDGKRLDFNKPEMIDRIAESAGISHEDLNRSIIEQVAHLTAVIHSLGYVGHSATDEKESDTDYHLGNFRISVMKGSVKVQFVADFAGFQELSEFANPEAEIENDYKSITIREYAMPGLSDLLGVPPDDIYASLRRARKTIESTKKTHSPSSPAKPGQPGSGIPLKAYSLEVIIPPFILDLLNKALDWWTRFNGIEAENSISNAVAHGITLYGERYPEEPEEAVSIKVETQIAIAAPFIQQALARLRKNYPRLAAAVDQLYPEVLPYYILGMDINYIQHHAVVMDFASEIAVGEGLSEREAAILFLSALFHDSGNGLTTLPKITLTQIQNAEEEEKTRLIKGAIAFRREHMEIASDIAGDILTSYYAERLPEFLSPENITEIQRLILHHDDLKIPMWQEKVDSQWLVNKNDRLLQYLVEADTLWMLTKPGMQSDIDKDGPSARTPDEQLQFNIDLLKKWRELYLNALGEETAIEFEFIDGTLLRSGTAYAIYKRLTEKPVAEKAATGDIYPAAMKSTDAHVKHPHSDDVTQNNLIIVPRNNHSITIVPVADSAFYETLSDCMRMTREESHCDRPNTYQLEMMARRLANHIEEKNKEFIYAFIDQFGTHGINNVDFQNPVTEEQINDFLCYRAANIAAHHVDRRKFLIETLAITSAYALQSTGITQQAATHAIISSDIPTIGQSQYLLIGDLQCRWLNHLGTVLNTFCSPTFGISNEGNLEAQICALECFINPYYILNEHQYTFAENLTYADHPFMLMPPTPKQVDDLLKTLAPFEDNGSPIVGVEQVAQYLKVWDKLKSDPIVGIYFTNRDKYLRRISRIDTPALVSKMQGEIGSLIHVLRSLQATLPHMPEILQNIATLYPESNYAQRLQKILDYGPVILPKHVEDFRGTLGNDAVKNLERLQEMRDNQLARPENIGLPSEIIGRPKSYQPVPPGAIPIGDGTCKRPSNTSQYLTRPMSFARRPDAGVPLHEAAKPPLPEERDLAPRGVMNMVERIRVMILQDSSEDDNLAPKPYALFPEHEHALTDIVMQFYRINQALESNQTPEDVLSLMTSVEKKLAHTYRDRDIAERALASPGMFDIPTIDQIVSISRIFKDTLASYPNIKSAFQENGGAMNPCILPDDIEKDIEWLTALSKNPITGNLITSFIFPGNGQRISSGASISDCFGNDTTGRMRAAMYARVRFKCWYDIFSRLEESLTNFHILRRKWRSSTKVQELSHAPNTSTTNANQARDSQPTVRPGGDEAPELLAARAAMERFMDAVIYIQDEVNNNQPIIAAIGRDFITSGKRDFELDQAIKLLMQDLRTFCAAKNVILIDADDNDLLNRIADARKEEGKANARIIALASFRKGEEDSSCLNEIASSYKDAVIIGVDNAEFQQDKFYYIRIPEMLEMAFKYAFGVPYSANPHIALDATTRRFPVLIPAAEVIPQEEKERFKQFYITQRNA